MSTGNMAKKLIQPTLSFKPANTPAGDDVSANTRKRKLSGDGNVETQVENSKVELVNGGTKCFIKSDDESLITSQIINETDVNHEACVKESLNSVISSLEEILEKNDKKINDLNTSKIDDNVIDVDVVSNNSGSEIIQNDTSVNSNSDCGQLGNITPTSNKRPNPLSAKKQEERKRLKQEKERAREEKQRLKLLEKEQKRITEIEAKRLRELEKERERKQKEDEKRAKELEKERERKQREDEKKS